MSVKGTTSSSDVSKKGSVQKVAGQPGKDDISQKDKTTEKKSSVADEKLLVKGEKRELFFFDDNGKMSITHGLRGEIKYILTTGDGKKVVLEKTTKMYLLAVFNAQGKQTKTLGYDL